MNDARFGVVGLGAIGSMLAWQLASRGHPVLGFDRFHPPHDRGGSGGETRLFRVAYAEGASYLPLLLRARELWHLLERESGRALLDRCGCLTIGTADDAGMQMALSTGRTAGAEVQILDRDAAAEQYPQHRLGDHEFAILDPWGGQLRADAAVLSALELAERQHNAHLEFNSEVLGIREGTDHVEIVTAERTWRVAELVVCTGAWSEGLIPSQVARVVEPRRVPLAWFLADRTLPYDSEHFPVFARITGGMFMYGGPSIDGATVKIGGFRAAQRVDSPDTLERGFSASEYLEAQRLASRSLHGLCPSPSRVDAFPDLFAPEHTPVVGRAGETRVSLAVAGSGRSFKIAPALGEGLAEMLTAESPRTALPGAGFLAPDRFTNTPHSQGATA